MAAPAGAQVLRAPGLGDVVSAAPAATSFAAPPAALGLLTAAPTALAAVPAFPAAAFAVPAPPAAVTRAAAPAAAPALPALRAASAWTPPTRPTAGESLRSSAAAPFEEDISASPTTAATAEVPAPRIAPPDLGRAANRITATQTRTSPAPNSPQPKPLFLRHYRLARNVVVPLLKLIYRIDVSGRRFLPAGPALIVPNHVSYMDPLLISLAANRPMRYLMYRGLYETPGLEWLFRALGAMPISSKDPRPVTAATLERARRALADGETVVIFPEGHLTYDGELDAFRTGFQRIAAGANVPVVPAGVSGMWGSAFSHAPGASLGRGFLARLFGRRRVSVRFGPALESLDAETAKKNVTALLDAGARP